MTHVIVHRERKKIINTQIQTLKKTCLNLYCIYYWSVKEADGLFVCLFVWFLSSLSRFFTNMKTSPLPHWTTAQHNRCLHVKVWYLYYNQNEELELNVCQTWSAMVRGYFKWEFSDSYLYLKRYNKLLFCCISSISL